MLALDSSAAIVRALLCAFATGYACRTALAWVSRPSPETALAQSRLTRERVLVVFAAAFLLVAASAGYPALILLPAYVYLLVRLFWYWQLASGPGVVTRLQLFSIARAGELAALFTLWFLGGKPLS